MRELSITTGVVQRLSSCRKHAFLVTPHETNEVRAVWGVCGRCACTSVSETRNYLHRATCVTLTNSSSRFSCEYFLVKDCRDRKRLPEQTRMCARAVKGNHPDGLFLSIDQQPIRTDMAFPKTSVKIGIAFRKLLNRDIH